jgi:hypothetical protein
MELPSYAFFVVQNGCGRIARADRRPAEGGFASTSFARWSPKPIESASRFLKRRADFFVPPKGDRAVHNRADGASGFRGHSRMDRSGGREDDHALYTLILDAKEGETAPRNKSVRCKVGCLSDFAAGNIKCRRGSGERLTEAVR